MSAGFLALLSLPAPAEAALATWVSSAGDDSNPCTVPDLPCRQLTGATGALAKTAAGGIIHVLPGDYAGFRIDKSIEIIADAGQASITNGFPGFGGFVAGISVETAATDIVRLRGLTVVVTSGSPGGIMLQSAGVLHVEDSTFVRSVNSFGIVFAPTGAGELHVSNSTISDNGTGGATGGGIFVKPSGSGSAKVVLENVLIDNNRVGILLDGTATTGTDTVTVRNSTISGSASSGIFAIDSGGGATNVTIEGSTSVSNGTFGIAANGANVTERVRNSTVSGNGTGLIATNTSKLISHGGNVVAGNTANGAFTQTIAQQ
jgi:hypothetical protein